MSPVEGWLNERSRAAALRNRRARYIYYLYSCSYSFFGKAYAAQPHHADATGSTDAPQQGGFQSRILVTLARGRSKTVERKFIDEISRRVDELIANTPVEDVQKNLRALLSGWFARLDLVTREEFDVQQAVLQRTREKLAQMEARVAELERALNATSED